MIIKIEIPDQDIEIEDVEININKNKAKDVKIISIVQDKRKSELIRDKYLNLGKENNNKSNAQELRDMMDDDNFWK